MTNIPKESWHLSKSVPVSLIIALILQFGGGVYLVAQADFQIARNAERADTNAELIGSLNADLGVVRQTASRQAIEMGKIGTSLGNIEKSLDRISRILEARR